MKRNLWLNDNYSDRKLFTGLVNVAFTAWQLMIKKAIITVRPMISKALNLGVNSVSPCDFQVVF
ncbi:hypothetical protein ACRQ5D_25450 [Mucilaginibacter sp. P25]|uniref:hypothetical protein n=1 Tax=Mucilaginibacter TaxID=423349 RepID=UPI000B854510|nr:hypothetical protein [Mucilaginibacter gossypii]